MPRWTDEQRRAIEARGHTVLVSAAAGSGKTAVLVERIVRMVCDEHDPVDIDRFLIVTFTRAAAAEMRERISAALTARLLENPHSRRLRAQLTRLARADILTTDAFCAKLLREHFQAVGLTPDFRVCDENEDAALEKDVLDEVIEDKYERSDENPGFLELVEALSAARNDARLQAVVLELYRKLQSHPFPERWLEKNLADMEAAARLDPAENVYGEVILSELSRTCRHYASRLAETCADIRAIEAVAPKYLPAFSADLESCRAVLSALETGGWNAVRDAVLAAGNKVRLGAVRNFDDPRLLDSFKQVRSDYHDALDKFAQGPFAHDAEKTREDCARILPVMEALSRLVSDFMEAFSQRKRAANLLDFSDVEHFVLKLLIDTYEEDGSFTPTDAAREIAQRYAEIAVDEYQDSNRVQDLIFRALSRGENNLFLVGDVKQSIYGFRLADPSVFMEKYRRFADAPEEGEGERVTLSRNFRSRREVIESVNYLFGNILSPSLGGIEYAGREALVCGADYPETPAGQNDSQFLLVEDPDDGRGRHERQADAVAARIRAMLDEGFPVTDRESGTLRPCRPEDFAILLRTVQNRAEIYAAAVSKAGIPVFTENAGQLFDGPEILALMSLAEVADNPDQDVALAAALHSPLYAFSADDLAEIRLCARDGSFYEALRACAQLDAPEDPALQSKCRAFLDDLADFRSRARDERADAVLTYILQKTNFLGRLGAAYGAEFSRARVMAFLSFASRSENSGYRGLYAFLNMMRALRDGEGIAAPSQAQGAGVRIMSIHKSKGLEFPIVFVPGLESQFNLQDLSRPVLIHPNLGAGFRLRPEGRMIEYPTLARHAVTMKLRAESLSEQMRVLYVALTRAQEKLFLVAAGEAEGFVKKNQPLSALSPIPEQALLEFASPLPWLLTPLLRLPCASQLQQDSGCPRAPLEENDACWKIEDLYPAPPRETVQAQAEADRDALPIPVEEFYARLDYVYPHLDAADLPSKLTATGLKGRFADEEVRDEARALQQTRRAPRARPRALTRQRLTPAQRGTALHMAMQFLDFSRADSREAIEAQIRDMAARRLLSEEAAQAVDPERLLAFFRSPLGLAMQKADCVRREFKFSLLADTRAAFDPAALARIPAEGDDTILFQGVIDCFFEEEDGLTVIDFKSDRVSEETVGETARGYAPQISAYACALTRITGRPVKAKYLYFFRLDREVPIA